MSQPLTILVAAGGTGGDLFPAVAVLEELHTLVSDLRVLWVGNPNRIEASVVPKLGYSFHPISVTGYKGIRSFDSYLLPFRIIQSLFQCRSIIDKNNVAGVLCGGTYISYPAGLAAAQKNIPMMLLEPNVVPGKTNRLLTEKARAVILAFEETKQHFPERLHSRMFSCGNPVRRGMRITLPEKNIARAALGLKESVPTVFAFGGSLGARSINSAINNLLLDKRLREIQLIWQTGKNFTPPSDIPSNVRVFDFIDDMATVYAAADLIISRAGGGTVSELMNIGKPAVLVPLPSAANNEQWHNAKVLEQHGAAIVIDDAQIADTFSETLFSLVSDTKRLNLMASAAHSLAKPDAAKKAAEIFLSLIG